MFSSFYFFICWQEKALNLQRLKHTLATLIIRMYYAGKFRILKFQNSIWLYGRWIHDCSRRASKSEVLNMSILTSNFDRLFHIFPNFAYKYSNLRKNLRILAKIFNFQCFALRRDSGTAAVRPIFFFSKWINPSTVH